MFKTESIQSLDTWNTTSAYSSATVKAIPTHAMMDDRGSGRYRLTVLPTANHRLTPLNTARPATQRATRETFKLLAIGSRQMISDNINELHLMGYAHSQEWSRIMPAPKRGEFMSILTKHALKPALN